MEPLKVPLELKVEKNAVIAAGQRGARVDCVVWGWEGDSVDEGPVAAEWFTRLCGRAVRLVRFDIGVRTLAPVYMCPAWKAFLCLDMSMFSQDMYLPILGRVWPDGTADNPELTRDVLQRM